MELNFFALDKIDKYPLIKGVVIKPLKVNRDDRGILVETLKSDWPEFFDQNKRPFAQNYFSETPAGVARDEDQWHIHPNKQEDRFVVVKGDIVVPLFDNRPESPTRGQLNLFLMGESNGDQGRYGLLIPKQVLHCFLVVSKTPAIILNYPTSLYDSEEEGRIPFSEVKLKDGSTFSWKKIRNTSVLINKLEGSC